MGPLDHVAVIGARLDGLNIQWVLGGSMASSLMGEARSTNDIDVAVDLPRSKVDSFIEVVSADYYAPKEFAVTAVEDHDSFNLIHLASGFKVDIFVLGASALDRLQLERRQSIVPAGLDQPIWVTGPADIVLRKLWWYDLGGRVSDRQWTDVLSVIRVQRPTMDLKQLLSDADTTGLRELVDQALSEPTDS